MHHHRSGKFKYNVLFALAASLVTFGYELVFGHFYSNVGMIVTLDEYGKLFALYFLISFLKSPATKIVSFSVILTFSLVQMMHFAFFGTWIFPNEIYLFFTHSYETFETFFKVLNITFIPLAILVPSWIIIYVMNKVSHHKSVKWRFMGLFLIVALLFFPIRAYVTGHTEGRVPSHLSHSARNMFATLSYFLGAVLPAKLAGRDSKLSYPIKQMPEKVIQNPDMNVVVIVGESLTPNHMSLFGYKRETTPMLDKLKRDPHFFYTKAMSLGVNTDVAIPSFINMIPKPNGINQIVSGNTCQFRLAKENGFHTYFISAQSQQALRYIYNYLCPKYVDSYQNASTLDKDNGYYDNALDGILVDELKKIDLSQNNFIVLHMSGSHSPYETRYPKSFEKFPYAGEIDKKKKILNAYDNSVTYSDYVIGSVVEYLKAASPKPTYLYYVSDHGQAVGENGRYGHGHLFEEAMLIPFLYYAIHTDEHDTYEGIHIFTQLNIGRSIGARMGYQCDYSDLNDSLFVNGADITGLAGYAAVDFNGSAINDIKIFHP